LFHVGKESSLKTTRSPDREMTY